MLENGSTLSPEELFQKGLKEKSIDSIKQAIYLGVDARAVILAIKANHSDSIQLFHRAGYDLNALIMTDSPMTTMSPMQWATMLGKEEIVQTLLNLGILVDKPLNSRGQTALHIACLYGQLPVVKTLVKAKANMRVADKEGVTPIFCAVYAEQIELFDYLLSLGISPDENLGALYGYMNLVDAAPVGRFQEHVKTKVGLNNEDLGKFSLALESLIGEALQQAKKENKNLLIALGEKHNNFKILQIEEVVFNIGRKLGINQVLFELPPGAEGVIKQGEMVKKLGMKAIGIDSPKDRNPGAIISSVWKRNQYMANQINLQNQNLISILGAAHLEGVLTDPQRKIDPDKFFIVPIHLGSLIAMDDISMFGAKYDKYLTRKLPYIGLSGFQKKSQNVIQVTQPCAISEVSSVLRKWNSNDFAPIVEEETKENEELISSEEMEEFKKDPEDVLLTGLVTEQIGLIRVAQSLGVSLVQALKSAIIRNNMSHHVRLLCQAGAHQLPCSGVSPLDVAVCTGNINAVRILLDTGVHVNSVIDEYGETALHIAARTNQLDIVKILIEEYYADQNIKANFDFTPLELAEQKGNASVVEYLQSASREILHSFKKQKLNPAIEISEKDLNTAGNAKIKTDDKQKPGQFI